MLLNDLDNRYVMIDSNIVPAHQQAACGKGGQGEALGRSRGGLTHQDTHGGRRPGSANAIHTYQRAGIGRSSGGSTVDQHSGRWVLVDKGCVSNRKEPCKYDRELYRERNLIERAFNRLKHWRRIATRYDRKSIYLLSVL